MPDKPCIEHERRISSNETFIGTVKDDVKTLKSKMDSVMKHIWLGVGAITAIQLLFNSDIGGKLLTMAIDSVKAYF